VEGEAQSAADREALGLQVAVEIARAFRDRRGAWAADALAEKLAAPVRVVRELLDALAAAGLLVELAGEAEGREGRMQLAAPAESISAADVLAALRGARRNRAPAASVERLLGELEDAGERVARAHSLATLASAGPRSEPP
jgi:DNA-binding IscR family transcriptional regulator